MMAAAFVVAWSSGFVGATLADRTGVDTWTLLAWRYLCTTLVLLVGCLAVPSTRRGLAALGWRDVVQQSILAVVSHVVFLGGVFRAAEQGLDAGASALVCALQPLLVAAAGCLLFGDRMARRQWLGLVLALGGVALSVGGAGRGGLGSVALVLASLAGLSAAALLERRWQLESPVAVGLMVQVVVATGFFAVLAGDVGTLAVRPSGTLVVAIAWLVLLSGLGGYATFTWCLRRLGATTTSTLLYLTAPVTLIWAWAMVGQRPTILQWGGLVVVLGGVVLALRPAAAPS